MIVDGRHGFALSRDQMIEKLALVHEALSQEDWVSELKFIPSAAMPVIKFVSSIGSIHIDLTCMGTMHHGVRTQQFIHDQLQLRPLLRPLLLFLKQLFRENELSDPFRGGLSSYATFMMVFNFLIWRDMACAGAPVSTGWALLQFLQQHVMQLDYSTMVFTGQGYRIRTMLEMDREGMFIEDPFDQSRGVAHGMYRESQLRDLFRDVHAKLQRQSLDAVLKCPFRGAEAPLS